MTSTPTLYRYTILIDRYDWAKVVSKYNLHSVAIGREHNWTLRVIACIEEEVMMLMKLECNIKIVYKDPNPVKLHYNEYS